MPDFKTLCAGWLHQYNYVPKSSNYDNTYVTFIHKDKHEVMPIITCKETPKQKTLKLESNINVLTIQSEWIEVGSPNLEHYLNTFNHYIELCRNNPPVLEQI